MQADPATSAGRQALAVHHLVEPITTSLERARHGRAVPDDREPAGARAGAHGARRRRRRRRRAARSCNARLTADVVRLGAELKRGRRPRRPQHQLADPAARAALRRPAGRSRADADQEDEDRRVDRRGDAGEAARRVAGVHRAAAAVPRGREAARHVRRGPAGRGRRRRADPRHVQPDRRPHRPVELGPPEPAQHPGAPGGGAAVPQGVRRRAGRQAARRRLQPDRAALHRPPRRRPGPRRGVHRAARTSTTPRRRGSSASRRSTSRSTSARRPRWCRTGWPTAWRPTASASG